MPKRLTLADMQRVAASKGGSCLSPTYKNAKTLLLALPVFKQGDDLYSCLEATDTVTEAFARQADTYTEAEARCRRMATLAAIVDLGVEASTHMISVSVLPEAAQDLVDAGILYVDEWDEYDEEDEYYEEE